MIRYAYAGRASQRGHQDRFSAGLYQRLQRWTWKLLLPLAAAAVAGCASTVPAQVTTFQQWPADAVGSSWRFETSPQQTDNLEYQSYADQLRAAIGATGLVEAPQGEAARFRISFHAHAEPVQLRTHEPYYDPFYGPWGPWGPGMWGSFGFGRGPWGFGMSMPLYPAYVSTVVPGQRNALSVIIREGQSNQKVYESKAVNTSSALSLPEAFPYLVRAIFDYFPDTNGQVRDVRIPSSQ